MADPELSGLKTILFDASSETPVEGLSKGTSFSFGNVAPGSNPKTIIIALDVPNANEIGNIQLGLTNDGSINFSNNIFGIESSSEFDNTLTPSTYFQGVNSEVEKNNIYNISIDNASNTRSNYVYLSLNLPSDSDIVTEAIRFQWFFDYD